jgi:putative drug exporter of the RND superfamily
MAAAPEDVTSGRPSRAYAATIVFLRFLVPPAWLAVALLVWQHGPTLHELPGSDVGALIPKGIPAERSERQIDRIFGSSLLPRIAVVQRDPAGIDSDRQRRILRQAVALVEGRLPGDYPPHSIAAPYLNSSRLFPAARERSTTAITYIAFPSNIEINHQRNLATGYADELTRTTGVEARATGFVPGNLEQSQAVDDHLVWVTLATLAVVALILGVYMRSLLAPLVTLAAAGISWLLATRAVAWMGLETGLTIQQEVEPIVAVLLLGVVTDYSVFFLAGSRARLLDGGERLETARRTTAQFIPIVFTAGVLVALGLTTLRVASIGFVRALGPAMAIVVMVSMLVSVTLVPALIALLGRRLYWPGLHEPRFGLGQRLRGWVTRMLTKRWIAVPVIALLAAGLVVAAAGVSTLRLGLTPIKGLEPGASAARGAHEAGLGFAPGIVSPTELALRRDGIGGEPEPLRRLARAVAQMPGVAAVVGVEDAPDVRQVRRLFRAPDGNAVRYLLVLDHDPYGADAIDDLHRVREALPGLLARSSLAGASVLVAGDTAIAAETIERIRHDIAWVALAAFAVNFVLLALFLRALVAPLLLIGASALALAATFGITTFVFQGLLGYSELTYYVPLAVGVLLLSFGSDYNLFVVGRIWQESEGRSVAAAIHQAAPRASRAISVAGVALALSFASLAIVPLRPFREFAFAMAVGVLVDTFLVRSYLIPALIALFGRHSWWPGRRGGDPAAPTDV